MDNFIKTLEFVTILFFKKLNAIEYLNVLRSISLCSLLDFFDIRIEVVVQKRYNIFAIKMKKLLNF